MRVRITRSTMLVLWCLVVQIAGLTPLPILAASGGGRAGALTAVQHPVATTMSSASAAPATSALTDTAMAIATPIPAHIQTRVASVTATISDTVSVSGAHPVSAPTPYAAISAAARLFDFDWPARLSPPFR